MKRAQLAAFYAFLVFTFAVPFLRQGLRLKIRWLPEWEMMMSDGTTMIEARFFTVDQNGRRELDRAKAAGHRVILRTDRDVVAAGQALCKELGPTADIRVVSRSAEWTGWQPRRNAEENLCAAR